MGVRGKLFHVKQFCVCTERACPSEGLFTEEFEMCECGVFLAVEIKVELGVPV